jgi:membrane protein YqaA with SNARE-associated domain
MTEDAGLFSLFAGSLLAATLLPGGSEAELFALLKVYPHLFWQALGVATLGNTIGGMSSYLIGRIFPKGKEIKGLHWVRQYGSPALLLAWAPLIGDALCVAAGWLRLNWLWAALFMGIGKFLRYWLVAYFSV